ncbi:MAG: thiamine pyrophosphate-binding protein, partial [Chloroflexota bacterium]
MVATTKRATLLAEPRAAAPAQTLSGAQMVCEALLREGVEVIFGYPGGQVIPLYDALPDYPLRHVLVRHEQAAA